jgi:hypothetical protein
MITIDMADAMAEMDLLIQRASRPYALLARIGGDETIKAKARIDSTKTDPLGDGWLPWRPGTARIREKKGNADLGQLYDSGHLKNSIYFAVTGEGVAIGTDDIIGAYQQDGTYGVGVGTYGYHVNPRPFLGWEPDSLDEYELMAVRYFAGATL